jgi:hypothetical protein
MVNSKDREGDMQLLRRVLSALSLVIFIAGFPELRGPLLIILFFVIVGTIHYLLWGRSMSRRLCEPNPSDEPLDEFAPRPDPDML